MINGYKFTRHPYTILPITKMLYCQFSEAYRHMATHTLLKHDFSTLTEIFLNSILSLLQGCKIELNSNSQTRKLLTNAITSQVVK